ncbi:MAG: right-handed parallel beta-helix repeat-containing protein, partial [Thermoplasmata archaeon]|nr:right-handed parallel beta-helix repeat-containing protein [Thermoplasmata archaeon]
PVIIVPGDRIHIDGNVTCFFTFGAYINAEGTLDIGVDTPGFPIFTADGSTMPGFWEGIWYSGGWGQIVNATIEYGTYGIWADNAFVWLVSNCEIQNCLIYGISYNFIMGGSGIDNCDIHDCGTAGVRTIDSSLMLGFGIGNRIHDCLYGVHATGWAGPAFVRNEIYNTTSGIFCDNLDGAGVDGNEIYNYTNSGIYLFESWADIRNNNITNDPAWSGGLSHGIHCYSNSHPWIDGNRIYDANGQSGIFLEEHSIPDVFTNVVIDNPGDYGIMLNDFSNVTAENCTIANCTQADWHVDLNSHAVSLNTLSDKVVVIADLTADLTMQWFMHVQVVDQFFTPVVGAEVWVNDSFGANVLYNLTGVDGWVSQNWTVVTEFFEDNGGRTYFTAHNATAISGLQQGWAMPEPFMDASRDVIIVLGAPSYNIFLDQGWNLISLPLIQADESIDQVLRSITGKWNYLQIYEAFDHGDPWKTNATFKPDQINDLKLLNHTIGFWINIIEPSATLTVTGAIPLTTNIPLYAGWNLVGYPSFNGSPISDALAGTGYDKPVEGYNASAPYRITQLADSYLMKPGEAYWVHVPADTIWTVDNSAVINFPYQINGFVYLYDGVGGTYTPMASMGGANVDVKWLNRTSGSWQTINTPTDALGRYSVMISDYY